MNLFGLDRQIIVRSPFTLRLPVMVAASIACFLIAGSASPATADSASATDPRPTIAETLTGNVVVVCKLIERGPGTQDGFPGTLEFVDAIRGGGKLPPLQTTGPRLKIRLTLQGEDPVGSTFVVSGDSADEPQWDAWIVVRPQSIDYIRRTMTRPKELVARGLALYADLGHPDPLIADDVAEEFRRLSYKELAATRAAMPHDKLVRLIGDKDVSWRARYQYGRMLSLCGTVDDLPALAAAIDNRDDWARQALPDTVAVYMAIRGEAAVPWVIEKLNNAGESGQIDLLMILEAVRRVELATTAIPKNRFPAIYREVVKYPHCAFHVLLDLERHKDWDSLPLWLKLERDTVATNNAKLGKSTALMFLISCPLPEAKRRLEEIRKAEPGFYKNCLLEHTALRSNACDPSPGDPRLPW